MKLISKEHPFSYLWILFFEIILGVLLTIGGLCIDLAIFDPPQGSVGFPFPVYMLFFALLSIFIISVSFIIIVIRIIYLYVKRRQNKDFEDK